MKLIDEYQTLESDNTEEGKAKLSEFLDKHMMTTRDLERLLGLESGHIIRSFAENMEIDDYKISSFEDFIEESIDVMDAINSERAKIVDDITNNYAFGVLVEDNGETHGLPVMIDLRNDIRYIKEEINECLSETIISNVPTLIGLMYGESHMEYRGECHGVPAYEEVYDEEAVEIELENVDAYMFSEDTVGGVTEALEDVLFDNKEYIEMKENGSLSAHLKQEAIVNEKDPNKMGLTSQVLINKTNQSNKIQTMELR